MKNACEFPIDGVDYNDWDNLMKLVTDVQKDACPNVNPAYIDAGKTGITKFLTEDAFKSITVGPPPKEAKKP